MSNTVDVGEVSAKQGEVKCGALASFDMRDGTCVDIPVIVVNGVKEGKTVLCIAGHHANETLGIEAAIQVARKRLNPKNMRGAFIAIPCATPFGFQMGTRTNPLDEDWVGPHYPGKANGILSERMAKAIWEKAVKPADVVIDLHSNFKPALNFVMVGEALDKRVSAEALSLASLCGVTIIHRREKPKPKQKVKYGSIAEMAIYEGKPSWLLEGNGSNTLEQKDVEVVVKAILNVCKGLEMVKGLPEPQQGIKIVNPRPGMKFVPIEDLMIRANRGGIVTRLVEPGELVKKGGVIARIHNLYGEEVEAVRAPVDGYTWGFPLRTKSALQTQAVFSGAEICYWFHEAPE